jgi:four helix bundle protein
MLVLRTKAIVVQDDGEVAGGGFSVKAHYKDLLVWQKAMALVTRVYVVTRSFPREEMYGLTSQIRRAAVSIPSNIAEGQARTTRGEFRHFLGIAKGSLAELDTQLIVAENLGYLAEPAPLFDQLTEVGRMLSGLFSSLSVDRNPPSP